MVDSPHYILRYRRGEDTWNEIVIDDGMVIGSAEDSQIIIDEKNVMPKHARLDVRQEEVWLSFYEPVKEALRDEESYVTKDFTKLRDGDVFWIGAYSFTFILVNNKNKSSFFSNRKTVDWLIAHAPQVGSGFLVLAIVAGVFFFTFFRDQLIERIIIPTSSSGKNEYITITDTSEVSEISVVEDKPTVTFEATINLTPSVSAEDIDIKAPGEGDVRISPIVIETAQKRIENTWEIISVIAEEDSIHAVTEITGENIGFLYRYVGMEYRGTGVQSQIITIDMSYIGSEKVIEYNEKQYPDWGKTIPVAVDWKPTVYLLSDGSHSCPALIHPIDYASTYQKNAVYAVDGIFKAFNGTIKNYARIFFDEDGKMRNIIGYRGGEKFAGAPFDIIPHKGDQFTVLLNQFKFEDYQGDKITSKNVDIELPSGIEDVIKQIDVLPQEFMTLIGERGELPYGKGKFINFEGETLTFGENGFSWRADNTFKGNFVVGFVVEDLDHNFYAAYVPFIVIEK